MVIIPDGLRSWGGTHNPHEQRLRRLVFLRFFGSLSKHFDVLQKSAKKNPLFSGFVWVVEPKGFEPLSSEGTAYAFYMLSFCLIFEKGKVSRSPIPFSLVALSYPYVATA
jgi:hypothetical protein